MTHLFHYGCNYLIRITPLLVNYKPSKAHLINIRRSPYANLVEENLISVLTVSCLVGFDTGPFHENGQNGGFCSGKPGNPKFTSKNAKRKSLNDLTLCKDTSKRVTKRLNFIMNKESLKLALPKAMRLLKILSRNSKVVKQVGRRLLI